MELGITPASGVAGRALADSVLRVMLTRTLGTFPCAPVFRAGGSPARSLNFATSGRAARTPIQDASVPKFQREVLIKLS